MRQKTLHIEPQAWTENNACYMWFELLVLAWKFVKRAKEERTYRRSCLDGGKWASREPVPTPFQDRNPYLQSDCMGKKAAWPSSFHNRLRTGRISASAKT
jgi:hypothetical protein